MSKPSTATTTYYTTIRHHSIARARVVSFNAPTLTQAKRFASREFAGEQPDYLIVIYRGDPMDFDAEWAAAKCVGDRRW